MHAQRFPFCSGQPATGVGFVSFGLDGHRQTAAGTPDLMLEQHQSLPAPAALRGCQRCETAPAESHSLQHALRDLAEPRRVHVTRTAAFLAVREYGAGPAAAQLPAKAISTLAGDASHIHYAKASYRWAGAKVAAAKAFVDPYPRHN